jgi:hypothetical protein
MTAPRFTGYDENEERVGGSRFAKYRSPTPDPAGDFTPKVIPGAEPDDELAPRTVRPGILSRLGRATRQTAETLPALAPARAFARGVRGVSRDVQASGGIRPFIDDVGDAIELGGSESLSATMVGVTDLLGADRTADRLRAVRERNRAELMPETTTGQVARVGARIAGDVGQFVATGAAGGALLRGAAARAGAGRVGGILTRLAAPSTRIGRVGQQVALGAPVNAAIAGGDPEESVLGVAAQFTDSPTLDRLAESPAARIAAEIGVDVVAGGIIEGLSRAPRPTSPARPGELTSQLEDAARAAQESEAAVVAPGTADGPPPVPEGLRDINPPDPRGPAERAAAYDRIRSEVFGEDFVRENPAAGVRQAERTAPDELEAAAVEAAPEPEALPKISEENRKGAAPAEDVDPYLRDDVPDAELPDRSPFDTPEVKAARRQARRQQQTTDLPDPDGTRRATRQTSVDRLYANRGEAELGKELGDVPDRATAKRPEGAPKRAWIVLGPPAAGKSTSIREIVKGAPWAVLIDADEAKKLIPEFEGGKGAGVVHEESSWMVNGHGEESGLFGRVLDNEDDFVWPMVGRNPDDVVARLDLLERLGYEVTVELDEVPLETSVGRAIARWKKTGRFVDPEYITSVGDGPWRAYERAKQHPATAAYRRVDTNTPKGGVPHVVEEGSRARAAAAAREDVRGEPVGRGGGAGTGDRAPGSQDGPGVTHPKPDPEGRAPEPKADRRAVGARLAGADGADDRITLPDGSKTAVRYRVVEASSLIPSHDAESFAVRPDYPAGVQGRRYHADKAAQANVAAGAQAIDPERLIRDTGSAGGTPIVTPDGIVLAGNQRTMMLQRAQRLGLESAGRYRAALLERAQRFGIDPAELEGMELPVLVREVTDPALDIADPKALRQFNDLSDTPTQKAKSAVDEGMTRANRLREAEASMTLFQRTVGADETLRDFLGDARGTAFARQLVEDGVFSPQEVARYIDAKSGKLTTDGKNLIEQMMYAAAVGDPDVLQRALTTIPAITRKLDSALPAIIRAAEGERGLASDLAEALDLLASVAKHKAEGAGIKSLDDLLSQGDMFGRAEKGRAQILAELLEGSKKADVTARFRRYATLAEEADRAGQVDDMFGYTPPNRDELFIMAFTGELPANPAIRAAAESPLERGWSTTRHLEPRRGSREWAEEEDFISRNGMTAAIARAKRIVGDPKEAFLAKHNAASPKYLEARRLLAAQGQLSAEEVAMGTRQAKADGELVGRDRFERGQQEMFGDAPPPDLEKRARAKPKEDAGQSTLFLNPRFASERLPEAGTFAQRAPAEGVEVSGHNAIRRITSALNEAMGLVAREGKLGRGSSKALGIFKPLARIIRQKNSADVGVFAHEMGHALHELLFGTGAKGALSDAPLTPFAGELNPLAKGISDETTLEGWAEFWRRWVDNPAVLRERAPVTLAYVEGRIQAEFPGVWNALNEGRQMWTDFKGAGAQARIAGQISRKESRHFSVRDMLRRLRKDVLDDLAPIERVMNALTNGKPTPEEDVATLARAARRSHGVAELFVERNTLDFRTHQPNGKGLAQILEPVKDRLDQFRVYLVAARAEELIERGIETGLRAEDVTRALRELEGQAGFKDAAQELYDYNTRLLEYLRDSGVMDQRLFEKIVRKNSRYVPFFRARSDEAGMAGRSLAFASLFNPTKKIKGSGREIIDPLESILKNTYAYVHLGHKQEVSKGLARLARRPGAGQYLEKVDTPQRLTRVKGADVAEWVASVLGDELDPADAEKMAEAIGDILSPEQMNIFRAGDYFGKDGMISVLENGKRTWYQVDPELYKALSGMDREQLALWAKIMAVPARTLRAGATLAPEFGTRNVLRDQLTAMVQSEYGFKPGVDFFRGLSHLLKKDDVWQMWRAGAGGRASLLSLDRETMRSSLSKALAEKPQAGQRAVRIARGPLDLLRAMSELMEDATRLGEAGRALKAEDAAGAGGKYAMQKAGQAGAEVTTDFGRKGAALANVRSLAAFWNARLQSYDRMFRSAKKHPGRFTARAVAGITVPSIGLFYLNKDDPDYWEVPQWQRDIFWLVPMGKDNTGHTEFLRIPKPFELGVVFGTIPERVLEAIHSSDPTGLEKTLKDFAGRQVTDAVPTPTALLPLVENYFNFSVFRQRPIVSRGLEEVEPRYQTTSRDSDFAKGLGRMLNYSPSKIDNLLFAYTGGLGRLAIEDVPDYARRATGTQAVERPSLTASDIPLVRGFAVRRPGRSAESVERFYDARSEAREAKGTMRQLERTGQRDELRERRPELLDRSRRGPLYEDVARQLDDLRDQVRLIEESRKLDGAEKRRRIERIEDRMVELTRRATGRQTPASRR